jgi:ribosomal protein S18 acetylase RimI-like enzyme
LLEDSFESWYLWHSRKILRSVDFVEKATLDGVDVGLVMLKMLDTHVGYVYYVAVSKEYRRQGVGGFLVERAMEYFSRRDANEILAAVEEDNEPSIRLFESRGFQKMRFSQLAKKYGQIKAARLWSGMLVVSGEVVFSRSPGARHSWIMEENEPKGVSAS